MAAIRKMFWRCPVCRGVHELHKENLILAQSGEKNLKQFCNVKLILIEIDIYQLQPSRTVEKRDDRKPSNNGWA